MAGALEKKRMLIKYSNASARIQPTHRGQQIWPIPGTLCYATYAEADKAKRNSENGQSRSLAFD
jgi:hypothetical protein